MLCTPSKEPIAPDNMYCRIQIRIRGVFFQESCPRALWPSVQDHIVMKLGTDHGTRHTCRSPSCSTRKEWRSMAGHSVEKSKCHCACRGHEAAPGHAFAAGLQASLSEFLRQVLAAGVIGCQWECLGRASISCPPLQLFCDLPSWLFHEQNESLLPPPLLAGGEQQLGNKQWCTWGQPKYLLCRYPK